MKLRPPQLPDSLEERILTARDLSKTSVLERFRTQGALLAEVHAMDLRMEQVEFVRSEFQRAEIAGARMLDCSFNSCDFANSSLTSCQIDRTAFHKARMTGLFVGETSFDEVEFRDCRLDMANFRLAVMKTVAFIDCDLRSADFQGAKLATVRFIRCQLAGATFERATLRDTDLRSSAIGELATAEGLSGGLIDHGQLLELAPLLAAVLRLEVRDE